jgi:hypothetical protein
MANISLYVSGQTELNDVAEFFQKRLIQEGENPIAFFDGVFYESHQERVGNIVYQDYLVYTDKAVYFWARGTSKDFLDRFTLGSVSINSRNKDSAFATLNLKIKRESREPVYVIFDMVEIREADAIVRLHTVVESTVEDHLGVNYLKEIPQDVSVRILQAGRGVCQPRSIAVSPEEPRMPSADSGIGYGQDLLEQYKASTGYGPQQAQGYPGAAPQPPGPGMGGPELPPGLEGMLPTDPASIMRLAGQIKEMVGDAPFKLRDQVMKDLQHVPNDVATVLTALNELLANIAGNPQAERFVMNAIKTAVSNDGIIGSVSKIIKLTGGLGGGRKSSRPAASPQEPSSRQGRPSRQDDDDDGTIRRRKISVRDDEGSGGFDMFRDEEPEVPSSKPARRPAAEEVDDDMPRRKKLSIRMEGGDDDVARKLMDYDESQRDRPVAGKVRTPFDVVAADPDTDAAPRRKKLSVRMERESDDIARKLMDYDESQRDQPVVAKDIPASAEISEEPMAPLRKKLAVKAADEVDDVTRRLMGYDESARDEARSAAPGEEPVVVPEPPARTGKPSAGGDYLMLESDLPVTKPSPAPAANHAPKAADTDPGSPVRDGSSGKPFDSYSLTAKPTS